MSLTKSNPGESRSYSKTLTIEVDVSLLKMGMYVSKLVDCPWEKTAFKFQGFLIIHPGQISKIREYCDYVYVDREKSIQVDGKHVGSNSDTSTHISKVKKLNKRKTAPQSNAKNSTRKNWSDRHSIKKQDLEPAVKTYKETSNLVKSIMKDIKLGHSIDTPAAKEAVAACVDNVITHTDAMLLLSRLRNRDEYTSEHSLNVAIISISLGRHAELNRKQLNEVGLSGLLHDMGKMLTPDHILNKPGRLTDEEMKVMQQHPADGHDILSSSSGIFHEAIHVAHSHHERMNGKGYPQGLADKDLSLYNRIVTIADVFDAITGDRVYKKGETVETALRILHDQRGEAFDPILVTQFIETVGIYPLGTVVEMNNGEIGIVVHTNPDHRLRPWIKIILNNAHKPRDPLLVNIAKPDLDPDGKPYWIKRSHNPRNFDIDLLKHIHGQLDHN